MRASIRSEYKYKDSTRNECKYEVGTSIRIVEGMRASIGEYSDCV